MNEFILVFVTASNVDEAQEIAMKLINAGLAPCVNILSSCTSIYQWKGEVRTDEEVLMVIKSSKDLFDELQTLVKKAHSYDVPEILAVDLTRISDEYAGYLGGFLSEG
jgi:periplasmic divalent cation tolerance protein